VAKPTWFYSDSPPPGTFAILHASMKTIELLYLTLRWLKRKGTRTLRIERSVPIEPFCRPLIFVAHPDDETLACGGLLQRLPASLVVFATDGAPAGYGLERKFGSMKCFAELRIQEAFRALGYVPQSSSKWLTRPDGSYFNDGHLFEELPEAATCLYAIAKSFSPDAILSHAYEGGHLDHEACSFLAMHIGVALSLRRFEFPLYWLDPQGKVVLQQFRDISPAVEAGGSESALARTIEWQLSESEIQCKKRMMAEYFTQKGTVSTFAPGAERIRPAATTSQSFSVPQCRDYLYQNRPPRFYHSWRHRLPAKTLLRKFAEFEDWWAQQRLPAAGIPTQGIECEEGLSLPRKQ
jgi:LmbE family N-acetylglucosaminyl deacetylase